MSFPIQKSAIDNIEHDLSHQYAELKIRIQAEQSNSSNGRFRLVALISTLLQRIHTSRLLYRVFSLTDWTLGAGGAVVSVRATRIRVVCLGFPGSAR